MMPHMPFSRELGSPLLGSLKTGVLWGIAFACLYSLFVVVLSAIRGPGFLQGQHLSLASLLLAYWVGGVLAGIIVGLLMPLGRWLIGAMLVGFIAAIPVFAAFQALDTPMTNWRSHDIVEILVLSIAFGMMGGTIVWREKHRG